MGLQAKKLIAGVGPKKADIMIIGEAPSSKEVEAGQPFVGPSGKTLNGWLGLLGLERSNIFITNLYKFQLPKNKAVSVGDRFESLLLLKIELAKYKPKIVICLGKLAFEALIAESSTQLTASSFSELNGAIISAKVLNSPVLIVPLLHPAYVSRFGEPEDFKEKLASIKEVIHAHLTT